MRGREGDDGRPEYRVGGQFRKLVMLPAEVLRHPAMARGPEIHRQHNEARAGRVVSPEFLEDPRLAAAGGLVVEPVEPEELVSPVAVQHSDGGAEKRQKRCGMAQPGHRRMRKA